LSFPSSDSNSLPQTYPTVHSLLLRRFFLVFKQAKSSIRIFPISTIVTFDSVVRKVA